VILHRIRPGSKWGLARDAGITLVSAGLLIAAFPSRDFGFLAWVALVPFFLAVSRQSFAGALLLSVFFGSVFLPGIFNWILELWYYRWYHHLLLAVYFGFYFAVFGGVVAFLSKRLGAITALWAAPFLWVTLEYLRSNFFFLALPWGLLAHTQYRYPVVIQMVSIFGTYGLSFLIVFFNAALSIGILFYLKGGRARQYTTASSKGGPNIVCLIAAGLYIFWMLGFGIREIWQPTPGKAFEISLIQANIPQSKKWDPEYADEIMKAYSDLTRKASRTRPDLIVWPETATPGAITRDGALFDRVTALVQKTGTPLLVGSAEFQKFQKAEAVETRLTNSAFLLNPSKEEVNLQRYDKIRLFPFGEYLPYKETLPWNWIRVSSLSQYAPGTEHTVFQLPPHRFAVTICWENIFPDLVRRFVNNGAQFIINLTNEARFGNTAAPYQLMAISVFRAVENGVFVVRCANTGVSGIIDPRGRVVRTFQDSRGQEIFVRGFLTEKIVSTQTKTFYTKHGDLVPFGSAAGCGLFLLLASRKPRKEKNGRKSGRC